MTKYELVNGDITKQNTEAIVNAANSSLLGGGGVDGSIHRAAGPSVLAQCRILGGCETGDAKSTNGGKLIADYIIHTVGPKWVGGVNSEDELLASCYRNCLKIADDLGVKPIAFPAVSTGIYSFPKERAAKIALQTVFDEVLNTEIELVRFVLYYDPEASGYYKNMALELEMELK